MSSVALPDNDRLLNAAGIIERPRLIKKVQGILDHKLLLISAPPGYGKTTLAAQFASQSPFPVLWHTVEERERDLPNLYNRTVALVRQIIPAAASLPDAQNHSPNELAALIADAVSENLRDDILYVFDDLHHLAGTYAAETWLRTLVTMMPGNCHLILISRILPDLPLAEMIARREVIAIGQEDLRFTLEETYTLAARAQETAESPRPIEEIQKLFTHLEGWPAGTVFALYPLPEDLERLMLSGKRGPEALFDLLATSMLRAQPVRLRDFLLASSTLTHLTPELCAEALGLSGSVELFAEFQIRNLFLSRTPSGLQYHALFRSFLQRQLKGQSPEKFRSLHVKAAHWFERHAQPDEAFEHYLTAGLAVRAAAIAERVAQSYFSQGKFETLLAWNAALLRAGAQAPRLSYICAVIYTDRYEYETAETELSKAQRIFAERGDDAGGADVRQQRAVLDLQRGSYQAAVEEAQALLTLDADPHNLRGRALKVLGMAKLRLGEIEQALEHLQQAVPLHRLDGDAYTLANVLQDLGLAYWQTGRVGDARACLQEVVALRRSLGSPEALALALNNLGNLYHSSGNYKQAQATFREGLNAIAKVPHGRAELYLLLSQGDLSRDLGSFDEALGLYRRVLELLGSHEPVLQCLALLSLATLRRWQGQPGEAIAIAEETLELAEHHSLAYETVAAQIALWAARARLDEAHEAGVHLELLLQNLRQLDRLLDLTQAYGICATVAVERERPSDADYYLRRALEVAETTGSPQPLVSEIFHTPKLQQFISARNHTYGPLAAEVKRLREMARQSDRPRTGPLNPLIPNTYSLRVYTLGPERIERDGEPIASSEWRTVTAQELFFYLLFAGPHTREQISVVFWPESSTKRVRASFHTTLFRARKALGENTIKHDDGLYFVNPEVAVWCDAKDLEAAASQARLLPPRDARTEDLWRRATELYRGEFLLSIDSDWVMEYRDGFHEDYLDALIGLGGCARARSDYREAVHAYRRALNVDPYREDIHRAIMLCYAALGQKQLISAQYDEIRGLLWAELGIEPSDETQRLADELLK